MFNQIFSTVGYCVCVFYRPDIYTWSVKYPIFLSIRASFFWIMLLQSFSSIGQQICHNEDTLRIYRPVCQNFLNLDYTYSKTIWLTNIKIVTSKILSSKINKLWVFCSVKFFSFSHHLRALKISFVFVFMRYWNEKCWKLSETMGRGAAGLKKKIWKTEKSWLKS